MWGSSMPIDQARTWLVTWQTSSAPPHRTLRNHRALIQVLRLLVGHPPQVQGTNSMDSTSTWSGLGEGDATKPGRQLADPLNHTQHFSFTAQPAPTQARSLPRMSKAHSDPDRPAALGSPIRRQAIRRRSWIVSGGARALTRVGLTISCCFTLLHARIAGAL